MEKENDKESEGGVDMLKFIPTGHIFSNRKEAVLLVGQGRYKRLKEKGYWEFIENNKDN